MEREVWTRVGMVLSVFVLVFLIVITPSLLGRPPPELESYPLLVIGMSEREPTFILSLGAAVQAYRYTEIRISISAPQPWNTSRTWINETVIQNDTYGYITWVPSNATFTVHVYFVDQLGNYFEYNVTARADTEVRQPVMIFTFPDENNANTPRKVYPPDDLRWLIPWRGTLP